MKSLAMLAMLAVGTSAASGCIWFHQRELSVHVDNDLSRPVEFRLTLDRIGVFGNSIQQVYNATHFVAGQGVHVVVIPKVGNGNHALQFSFMNSGGQTLQRTIHLLYEESPEDDPTDAYVRIKGESDFEFEAPGRGA